MSKESENKGKPGHGKRILLRTFGCQMNTRDSEFIAGIFIEKGYKLVDSPDRADVILFNTCSVRAHAAERAVSNMGHLMKRKAQSAKRRTQIYGMVGCAAQALGDGLFKRLPELDIVCGTGEIARLPELVEEARNSKVLALNDKDAALPELTPSYRESERHAYVSIMRGCNNFCSYCVVPYVRGRERSRKVGDIVKEVKDLVRRGIKEITLLGQNVNSYRGIEIASSAPSAPPRNDDEGKLPRNDRRCNFVGLLGLINKIDGIKSISFLTSHPKDANIKLFKAMRDCGKVFKHLHLPLQSASDRILGLMKRGYTRADYLGLAGKARKIIPGLRLTTDIIVGFPTETDSDFRDTLNLMKDVKFGLAYIFKYSPRQGTKASLMRDDVPEETKKIRHKILLDFQKEIALNRFRVRDARRPGRGIGSRIDSNEEDIFFHRSRFTD